MALDTTDNTLILSHNIIRADGLRREKVNFSWWKVSSNYNIGVWEILLWYL